MTKGISPRARCWNRAPRGGLSFNGSLSQKALGTRIVLDENGAVVKKPTQGKLLHLLKTGAELTEYVYPPHISPQDALQDIREQRGTQATSYVLDTELVAGKAAKARSKARRGNHVSPRNVVAAIAPDDLTWWYMTKTFDSIPRNLRRSVLSQGMFSGGAAALKDAQPVLKTLNPQLLASHPWEVIAILQRNVDEAALEQLRRDHSGLWDLVATDPELAILALTNQANLSLLNPHTKPVDKIAIALGLNVRDVPENTKDAVRWIAGYTGESRDYQAWLAKELSSHSLRAVCALSAALGGKVGINMLNEMVRHTTEPKELLSIGANALQAAVVWGTTTSHLEDATLAPTVLKAAKLFGRQTQSVCNKANSVGWTLHDVVASLPDLSPADAKDYCDWMLQQDVGWASNRRSLRAVTTVGQSWTTHGETLRGLDLKAAAIYARRSNLFSDIRAQTRLADIAAEIEAPRADQALRYWAGSHATPMWAPTQPIPSKASTLTGQFLDRADPRGIFLGQLTDCCQSIGSAGATCAVHGQAAPDGQFFIVYDKGGTILAQSWAWLAEDGSVCFDNIELLEGEHNPERRTAITQIYKDAATLLQRAGAPRVTTGADYTDQDLLTRLTRLGSQTDKLLTPLDSYKGLYRDSTSRQIELTSSLFSEPHFGPTPKPGGPNGILWYDPDTNSDIDVAGSLKNSRRTLTLSSSPSTALLKALQAANPTFDIYDNSDNLLATGEAAIDDSLQRVLRDQHIDITDISAAALLHATTRDAWDGVGDFDPAPESHYAAEIQTALSSHLWEKDPAIITGHRALGLSEETTAKLLRQDIRPGEITSYIELGAPTVEVAANALLHNIRSYEISDMREFGLSEFTDADFELFEFYKRHGIGVAAADELRAAGVGGLEDLRVLEATDVPLTYYADYKQLNVDDAETMRDLYARDLYPRTIRGYHQQGVNDIATMRQLATANIADDDIERYAAGGVVGAAEALRAKEAGVEPMDAVDYGLILKKEGKGGVEDLLALKATGIDAFLYRAFYTAGITDHVQMQRLSDAGVAAIDIHNYETTDVETICAYAAAGLSGLAVKTYQRSGVHTLAQMKDLHHRGLNGSDLDGYEEIGITEVARMQELKEKKLPPREIKSFQAAGIDDYAEMQGYIARRLRGSDVEIFTTIGITAPDQMRRLLNADISPDHAKQHADNVGPGLHNILRAHREDCELVF